MARMPSASRPFGVVWRIWFSIFSACSFSQAISTGSFRTPFSVEMSLAVSSSILPSRSADTTLSVASSILAQISSRSFSVFVSSLMLSLGFQASPL
jgi:hypothetical protein